MKLSRKESKELGLDTPICRRDFLQGMSVGIGSVAVSCQSPSINKHTHNSLNRDKNNTLKGQCESEKNLAHSIRNNSIQGSKKDLQNTRENYDLVVVGSGIAGLTAAYTYRKEKGSSAKILVIDNASELAGHARRNTFNYRGQDYIAPGGTYALEEANESPVEVLQLFKEIGLDLDVMKSYRDESSYKKLGLSAALLYDPKIFKHSKVVWQNGFHSTPYEKFFANAPVSNNAKEELIKFYSTLENFLGDTENKKDYLKSISWKEFINKQMNLSDFVLPFADLYSSDLCGLGSDAVSAWEAYKIGPGFHGMGGNGFTLKDNMLQYAYNPKHRFPDGNHTIARMLLKKIKPEALNLSSSMEDIFNANINYDNFDLSKQNTRIRLNTMVTNIKHIDPNTTSKGVSLSYMGRDRKTKVLKADRVIMAGWGMVAKHIIPELPIEQKSALQQYKYSSAVYINVLLKNWRAIADIGASTMYLPGGYCSWMRISDPLSVGSYSPAYTPDKPTILSMYKYLYTPGLPPVEQMKMNRHKLEKKTFAHYEVEIRRELNRLFGPWGFDASRDIAGLTVNRWGHGYNYFKTPEKDEKKRKPFKQGREQIGRISFAGADAGGSPWSQAAMKEAIRAAHEQLS